VPPDLSNEEKSRVNREIIAIIHASGSGRRPSITQEDVLALIDELKKVKGPKDQTHFDVILNSPGGDIHAAYKLIKVLRSRCRSLNVIVPFYAKSAATLLSLGSDRIYMGQQSELGPLDALIEHPLTEGMWLSALDGVKPLEILSDFCESLTVDRIGLSIRTKVALGRRESVELALDFAAKLVAPIIRQLDPLILNMCFRYLQVAEKYGKELLREYMFKGHPDRDELAEYVIKELVWEYPEHEYAIGIDEARRLKLIVEEAESLPEWDRIWDYYKEREGTGTTHIRLATSDILSQIKKGGGS